MEFNYRNNVLEFCYIYLNKNFNDQENELLEFTPEEFSQYVFYHLFNINITTPGFGLDNSTKQMTNNIGDLKIYKEDDVNKENYLSEIKPADLLFFHTKNLDSTTPTPNNQYPGHIGIYLGNKEFIHVSPIDNKITIDKIENNWLNSLVASRDIIKEIIQAYK